MDPTPFDTIHHAGGVSCIGTFTCRPGHPTFHDTGPARGYLLVFPRTSVVITHAGAAPEIADRTVAMVYNEGQAYRREQLSPEGDICDWFAVPPDAVVDAVRVWEPEVVERRDRPFRFRRAPTDSSLYLRQREVVIAAARGTADPFDLEDAVLGLLRAVVDAHYRLADARPAPARPSTRRRHRELVEAAREVLARDFAGSRCLDDLAEEVGASPYHLSRLFRQYTGTSLHAHRHELRLRYALGRLHDPRADLTQVALEAGYSSHSHFGSTFRRAFGMPPSRARARLSTRAGS